MNKKVIVLFVILALGAIGIFLFINMNDDSYEDYANVESNVDLGYYYDNQHFMNIEPSNNYVTDTDINAAIEELKTKNSYSAVVILDEWDDVALNVHSYNVLFDDNTLYTITKDDAGRVFSNIGDYEYYLEMN